MRQSLHVVAVVFDVPKWRLKLIGKILVRRPQLMICVRKVS